MSKKRFDSIKRYLQIYDPDEEQQPGDKLHKVRWFLASCLANIQRYWNMGQDMVIDEGMVAYCGRLIFKQYIKVSQLN